MHLGMQKNTGASMCLCNVLKFGFVDKVLNINNLFPLFNLHVLSNLNEN